MEAYSGQFAPSGGGWLHTADGHSLWAAVDIEDDTDSIDDPLLGQLAWRPAAGDSATAIRVYAHTDIPAAWAAHCSQGGDEDWVAHVPAGIDAPVWLDEGGRFGCCSVLVADAPDGSGTLHTGCHA